MRAIFASDMAGGFGYQGRLPWPKIAEDMRHFVTVTSNNIVVMGRNTYNSLPTLPNRISVVLSSKPVDGVFTLNSYDQLLEFDKEYPNLIVIGGASILTPELIKQCSEVYHTTVKGIYESDVFISPDTLCELTKKDHKILLETDRCVIRKYE